MKFTDLMESGYFRAGFGFLCAIGLILMGVYMQTHPYPQLPNNTAMIDREFIAHELYTTYCAAVGGKAFNGDPLPSAAEFFADAAKTKQADAWRSAADRSVEMLLGPS